jgi:hypothetical protein
MCGDCGGREKSIRDRGHTLCQKTVINQEDTLVRIMSSIRRTTRRVR